MLKKALYIFGLTVGFSFLCGVVALGVEQPALAKDCRSDFEKPILTIPPWYHQLCDDTGRQVEISEIPDDIVVLLLNIVNIAIQIGGYVAVGFVIWGGIKYVLSNGESNKTASAKTTIQNALIGLLIVLASVAIVNFIIDLY